MTTKVHEPPSNIHEALMIGGIVMAALLLLPLLALTGFFLQFAFVIVGPAALLVALVYAIKSPAEPTE